MSREPDGDRSSVQPLRSMCVQGAAAPLKSVPGPPDASSAMRIQELKRAVQSADYVVDPDVVADAMLRRAVSYRRWWKPRSTAGTPAQTRFASPGPERTRPTHVTPAASAAAKPSGPTQTHSS